MGKKKVTTSDDIALRLTEIANRLSVIARSDAAWPEDVEKASVDLRQIINEIKIGKCLNVSEAS